MEYIQKRRKGTNERLVSLRNKLASALEVLGDKACVYATGSFGRLEAGQESDLDLFIVSKTADKQQGDDTIKISQLSQLDTILVKAELITAVRELSLPDFDADGRYLAAHTVAELTKSLGAHDDDYKNTLTGRLLLFLESQPLLGAEVYEEIIQEVIAAYYGDYSAHAGDFIPAFLANDILRLWRTFCVNYEFGRRGKRIEGKIKNYKLKHSRMLTCYSALLYLLGVHRLEGTVSISRAKEMARLTPTERLEWLLQDNQFADAHEVTNRLLGRYAEFLQRMDLPKHELQRQFAVENKSWTKESYQFGDMMSEALAKVGAGGKFYRLIVV